MQTDWAAALLDPEAPLPPGLSSWNGSDPRQRFDVYRNNVVVSLVESLVQTFPVVHQLVGDDFFRAMGREFVRAQPPRSALLAHYGEGFAEFVRGFAPAASLPYLADMARLEMHCLNALHAADFEALEPQALEYWLGNPERLPQLRLRLHPSLYSLQSKFAVFSLWTAHRDELGIAGINPAVGECGWILRSGLQVKVARAGRGDCDFVDALAGGAVLGEAAETAARDSAFDLGHCLGLLLGHGMLVSEPGDRQSQTEKAG